MACCVEQTFHSTCSVELEHVEATPGAGRDRHSLSTTLRRQCHALDFAAIAKPELHGPDHARGRVDWNELAIDPIHFRHVRDVGKHHMHAHNSVERRTGRFQHVLHVG
jgi:hypothetical protein